MLAREHVFSTQGTQFSRLDFFFYICLIFAPKVYIKYNFDVPFSYNLKNKVQSNNKKIFLTCHSKLIDVLCYKYNITSMTLVLNQLNKVPQTVFTVLNIFPLNIIQKLYDVLKNSANVLPLIVGIFQSFFKNQNYFGISVLVLLDSFLMTLSNYQIAF